MADSDSNIKSVPTLVGPDGRTPASLKNVRHNVEVKKGRPIDEARCAELIQAGVMAGFVQINTVLAEENARLFSELEQIAVDRVLAEIRRRSLRGRIEAGWLALVARLRDGRTRLTVEQGGAGVSKT